MHDKQICFPFLYKVCFTQRWKWIGLVPSLHIWWLLLVVPTPGNSELHWDKSSAKPHSSIFPGQHSAGYSPLVFWLPGWTQKVWIIQQIWEDKQWRSEETRRYQGFMAKLLPLDIYLLLYLLAFFCRNHFQPSKEKINSTSEIQHAGLLSVTFYTNAYIVVLT